MTWAELIAECDRCIEHGIGLVLVGQLRGFRGELLCVNSQGERVYRFSLAQVKRMRKLAQAESGGGA